MDPPAAGDAAIAVGQVGAVATNKKKGKRNRKRTEERSRAFRKFRRSARLEVKGGSLPAKFVGKDGNETTGAAGAVYWNVPVCRSVDELSGLLEASEMGRPARKKAAASKARRQKQRFAPY